MNLIVSDTLKTNFSIMTALLHLSVSRILEEGDEINQKCDENKEKFTFGTSNKYLQNLHSELSQMKNHPSFNKNHQAVLKITEGILTMSDDLSEESEGDCELVMFDTLFQNKYGFLPLEEQKCNET